MTDRVQIRRAYRDQLRAELADRFRAEWSRITIADLASSYGRRPNTIRRLLEEAGITSRRHLLGLAADEVLTELAALYQRGATVAELVALTGIEDKRIARCVRAAGVARRPLQLAMSVDELADAYRSGSTIAELAQRAGVSPTAIRNLLLKAGVEMRPAVVRNRRPD